MWVPVSALSIHESFQPAPCLSCMVWSELDLTPRESCREQMEDASLPSLHMGKGWGKVLRPEKFRETDSQKMLVLPSPAPPVSLKELYTPQTHRLPATWAEMALLHSLLMQLSRNPPQTPSTTTQFSTPKPGSPASFRLGLETTECQIDTGQTPHSWQPSTTEHRPSRCASLAG